MPARRIRTVAACGGALLALAFVQLAGATGHVPTDGRLPAAVPNRLGALRQDASADERLAATYAPIMILKEQTGPCDTDGEPYLPVPVEVVLGDPAVALKQDSGGEAAADPVVKMGPTAADLFGKDETYYLDLPGNPRAPGCDYERYLESRLDGQAATAYAHIATEPGQDGLALQYWFFFPFNDFNNTHEADWEMLQLRFAASSAEEALTQEPVQIAFAQHGGGETAAWDDPKLQREGTRPIVFAAAGSHASQYADAVYLGWGDNGTGFGCDVTTGPSVPVPLEVRLVPSAVDDPASPFAWLNFGGRWGERQPWEYNGPRGPNLNSIWQRPFTWQDDLRTSSIEVAVARTLGPAPTEFFCEVTGFASFLLTRFQVYPWLIGVGLALALGIGLGLLILGWPVAAAAAAIYGRHAPTFALLGLMLIPIGLIANGFQYLVTSFPPGKLIYDVMNESPGARLAAALTVGSLQQLVGLILVGPAGRRGFGGPTARSWRASGGWRSPSCGRS